MDETDKEGFDCKWKITDLCIFCSSCGIGEERRWHRTSQLQCLQAVTAANVYLYRGRYSDGPRYTRTRKQCKNLHLNKPEEPIKHLISRATDMKTTINTILTTRRTCNQGFPAQSFCVDQVSANSLKYFLAFKCSFCLKFFNKMLMNPKYTDNKKANQNKN